MLKHLNATPTNPQRVVVIGAGGFVGSNAVKNLQAKNIPTLAVTRNEVDLLKPGAAASLAALIQPNDALVVVSAIAPCKNAEQLLANLNMMQSVCEAIKSKAADISHVIYISSDAVYADDVSLATETSTLAPSSFHGMMHAAREMMIKAAAGSVPLAILRPSNLFGVNDPHNGYGPNRFLRLAQQNQKISFFGGGEEKRDHIYIEDVAEIIALTLLNRSQGTLNIATGHSFAFSEVADMAIKVAASNSIVEVTARNNPITHRHFDITACRQAFPAFKYVSLEQGLMQVQAQVATQAELV